MRKRKDRNQERGMALLIALLALLLVSAIGMGMMYMSTTETSINANYRDTQQAFFAMRGGLEEARDRMRKNAVSPLTLPTVVPNSTTAGSILYITNPSASETVDPVTYGSTNKYFDDEFCHEGFTGVTYTGVVTGVPCTGSAQAPPSAAATTTASVAAYTGTAAALNYKWVRITMKQNATIGTTAKVDPGQPTSSQVCWDSSNSKEIAVTALGYSTCALAQNAGYLVAPIYILTSLAYTPQGSRRMGQYEVAAVNITPPPGALSMDGPGATFTPVASSNNFFMNGNNNTTYTGPGTCSTTTPAVAPGVSTGSSGGVTSIDASIQGPPDRTTSYTGTNGTPTTPSVVDQGTDAGGTGALGGLWASPLQLNNLVASIANGADQTLSGCGISGTTTASASACGYPVGGLGTDANPLITYVNGDFNMGDHSGAGLLVVTGTLSIGGNAGFDGLVLVIGQGIFSESGGGNGQFNGSLFVANTKGHTSPFTQLGTLGSPQFAWNGGGTNGIQFNSCWANLENDLHFMVVSSREEMY